MWTLPRRADTGVADDVAVAPSRQATDPDTAPVRVQIGTTLVRAWYMPDRLEPALLAGLGAMVVTRARFENETDGARGLGHP